MTVLLLALLVPAGSRDDVKAVAQLYYDACVMGSVRAPASEVEKLDEDAIFAANRRTPYALKISSANYLRFKNPRNTYLSMITFQQGRQALKSSCSVATSAISPAQALQVFKLSSPGIEPRRQVPFFTNVWEMDFPKEGYRKSFHYGNVYSVFTTEVFARKGEKSE